MNRLIRNFVKKYQDFITPVVMLLLALSGIVFGIMPAGAKVVEIWGKIDETRKSIALLTQKSNYLDSLNETDLQNQLKAVVAAVPQDKSLASILGVADQLGNKAGVTLQSFNIAAPGSISTESAKLRTTEEQALGVSLIPFQIRVSGLGSNVRTFIDTATQVRRLIRIDNFDISFLASGTGSGSLRANLDAFYAPLPQLGPMVEQSLPDLTSDDQQVLTKLSNYPWLTQQITTSQNFAPVTTRIDPFSR